MKSTTRETRRRFLMQAGAVTAGTAVSQSGLASIIQSDDSLPASLAGLKAEHLERFIGQAFSLSDDSGRAVRSKLASIEVVASASDVQRPAALPRRQGFIARFAQPSGTTFSNKTYAFNHVELGSLPMLVCPVKDAVGMICLEAVFN